MADSQDFPDTQPNNDSITDSQMMESQPVPYGRIFIKKSITKSLGMASSHTFVQPTDPGRATASYDISKTKFVVGRDTRVCDLVIDTNNMTLKLLEKISKIHFQIERADENSPVILQDLSANGTFVNNELVGKLNKRILRDEDTISLVLPRNSLLAYRYLGANHNVGLPQDITDKYFICNKLGSGACGIVYRVHNIRNCGQFAMKRVEKIRDFAQKKRAAIHDPNKIMNEVNIMKSLQHPCIVRMMDIVDTPNALFMVLELMDGGDLLNRIINNRFLQEEITKFFFLQMCHAVDYMHANHVTHRDLKPDNILLNSTDTYCLLKVSDFGLSKIVDEGSMMKTMCGTPLYVAPEILMAKVGSNVVYTNKVDVWSMGVVLFTMLSGSVPFSDDYPGGSAIQQIKDGKFKFNSRRWDFVSDSAKAIIKRMLTVRVSDRPSVREVMTDVWLQDPITELKVNAVLKAEKQAQLKMAQKMENIRLLQENIPLENPNIFRAPTAQQPPAKRQRLY